MEKIEVDANLNKLDDVMAFIGQQFAAVNCSSKCKMAFLIAAEEIFVNIANYAYGGNDGKAVVGIEVREMDEDGHKKEALLELRDWGRPFNPLVKSDPDIKQKAAERSVGGLGIYLMKKSMDGLAYEYRDGQNILVLRKELW